MFSNPRLFAPVTIAVLALVAPDYLLGQAPAPAPTNAPVAVSPTPKPAPKPGERGTVDFWQKEFQGKFKSGVKEALGAPSSIEQSGDIYVYKSEFFHPDLDQWRDLRITFSSKDGAVESFTGSGGDTKSYEVDAPMTEITPTPTPTPAPTLGEVSAKAMPSVVTIEYTEPLVEEGSSTAIDQGTGATGFVVLYKGKKYVLTNIHVLAGEAAAEVQLAWVHGPRIFGGRLYNKARIKDSFEGFLTTISRFPLPRIKDTSGADLKPGKDLLFCSDRDIVLIPVDTQLPGLSLSPTPPSDGLPVVVIGNERAAHTLATIGGNIARNGPERFNVEPGLGSAPAFVGGMSGSPVVDLKSGAVLGVISYVFKHDPKWVRDTFSKDAFGGTVVRYYEVRIDNTAYRLDNLDNLQSIPWAVFLKDYAIYWAKRERIFNAGLVGSSEAVDIAVGADKAPVTLDPDFNNRIQLTYSSFCRDFRRIVKNSDAKYVMDAWDTYRRTLQDHLRADPYKVTTPWIRFQLETAVNASEREVTKALDLAQKRVESLAAAQNSSR